MQHGSELRAAAVTLSTLPGIIGRYLMMLKVTDILDIAIMVFVFYKALTLIQSTRAASLLKGVLVSVLTFFLYKRVERLFFRKKTAE